MLVWLAKRGNGLWFQNNGSLVSWNSSMNFQMDGFKEERIIKNQYEFMKSYWDNFSLISSMVMRLRNQKKRGLLMSISGFLLSPWTRQRQVTVPWGHYRTDWPQATEHVISSGTWEKHGQSVKVPRRPVPKLQIVTFVLSDFCPKSMFFYHELDGGIFIKFLHVRPWEG